MYGSAAITVHPGNNSHVVFQKGSARAKIGDMCLLGFITYLLVTEVSRENVGQRTTLLNLNVTLINSGPGPAPTRKGVQLKYTHTHTHTHTHKHTQKTCTQAHKLIGT